MSSTRGCGPVGLPQLLPPPPVPLLLLLPAPMSTAAASPTAPGPHPSSTTLRPDSGLQAAAKDGVRKGVREATS